MTRQTVAGKKYLLMGVAAAAMTFGGAVTYAAGQAAISVTQQDTDHAPHVHPEKAGKAVPERVPTEAHGHGPEDTDHEGEGSQETDEHGHGADEEEEGFVRLTPAQRQASGIQTVLVSRGGGAETRLSGRVAPMVDAKAAVGASVSGVVERVLVATGEPVKAGQAIAVVVSGDAAAVRADVEAAAAAAEAARQASRRSESLFEQGIVARQEVETLRAQALSSEAMARAAQARAAASGNPDAAGRLRIVSPIAGTVTSVQISPGGFVVQGAVVAEVTNSDRVELVFNAPPLLASQAKTGTLMIVQGPAGEFEAVVTGVAADAGAGQSGAAIIRARPSESANLPSGSPVSGAIVTGRSDETFSVPSQSVQTMEGNSVVFVDVDGGFRAVPVLTGRQAGGRTEILKGLEGKEKVASSNAFLLKAELSKGEAEHGH